MANTLNGINIAQVAQESLGVLLEEMTPLNAFTLDLSANLADRGESVTTRVAGAVSAGDASSGYTASDVSSTAKTVNLSNHKHFTMGFSDLEIAKGGFDVIQRTFIRPAVHAIAKSMMNDALALVDDSNFTSSQDGSGGFSADLAADCAGALDANNVPKVDRSVILNATSYTALAKDDSIHAAYAFGSADAIRNNVVPRVHGFDVYEYTALDSSLAGIACAKEGIIIAARQPAIPQNWNGATESVTADNGMTLQFRSWYEGKDGKQYLTATAIYGVAVGVSENLIRVTA